jgi:hypothetical protein
VGVAFGPGGEPLHYTLESLGLGVICLVSGLLGQSTNNTVTLGDDGTDAGCTGLASILEWISNLRGAQSRDSLVARY